jgi:hypothetical protein
MKQYLKKYTTGNTNSFYFSKIVKAKMLSLQMAAK